MSYYTVKDTSGTLTECCGVEMNVTVFPTAPTTGCTHYHCCSKCRGIVQQNGKQSESMKMIMTAIKELELTPNN